MFKLQEDCERMELSPYEKQREMIRELQESYYAESEYAKSLVLELEEAEKAYIKIKQKLEAEKKKTSLSRKDLRLVKEFSDVPLVEIKETSNSQVYFSKEANGVTNDYINYQTYVKYVLTGKVPYGYPSGVHELRALPTSVLAMLLANGYLSLGEHYFLLRCKTNYQAVLSDEKLRKKRKAVLEKLHSRIRKSKGSRINREPVSDMYMEE